jgi:hypothetical protein
MPLSMINATNIDLIQWAQLNDFDDLVSAISDHKLTGRSLTRLSCTTIEQMLPEVGLRLLFEDFVECVKQIHGLTTTSECVIQSQQ